MKKLILIFCTFLISGTIFSQKQILEKELNSILKDKNATIGIAVIYDGKDTLSINNQYLYPTMSVYKFHLALAVLHHLDKNHLPLDTQLFIKKSDLRTDTYSPLQKKKPQGEFYISIGNLLQYSVSQSDNNACDILFNYVGGTQVVENYIRNLGIEEIAITKTEHQMGENPDNQYLNWTRPLSMVHLLEVFLNQNILSKKYHDFLLNTLLETSTGPDKIKGLLPENIKVGHKTGNSSRYPSGIKVADNDTGFIELPNGKKYSLAVFIMNSKEEDKTNAKIIAEISKTVFDYYNKR